VFQSWFEWAFVLYCLVTGIVLGTLWTSAPLKRKIEELQSVLEMDSAQKMERILMLEEELRFAKAKALALESDLDRIHSKYWWKE